MGQQVDNWRKSSKSANGGEQCVEVGAANASIAVRDTNDRAGAVLTVPADAWKKFTATLR